MTILLSLLYMEENAFFGQGYVIQALAFAGSVRVHKRASQVLSEIVQSVWQLYS